MEETKKKWKMPQDVVTYRTNDPVQMLFRYVASDAYKTWTEDFTDTDTGEVVSIERNQLCFKRGQYLHKDRIQEVMFAIQAGDIKDIEVTDTFINAERFIGSNLIPWEVTLSFLGGSRVYLVRAQAAEMAIKIAEEFAAINAGEHGAYSVRKVAAIQYVIIEQEEQHTDDAEQPTEDARQTEYYVTTVRLSMYDDFDDGVKETSSKYVVAASEVGEAKERTAEYIKETYAEELQAHKDNGFDVTKAVPYNAHVVVPLEYCKCYHVEPTI